MGTEDVNISYVKVSYDSGSDGDVDSDEGDTTENMVSKKFSLTVASTKPKTERKSKVKASSKKRKAKPEMDSEGDDDDDGRGGQIERGEDGGDEGGGWADAMASILRKEAPEEGSAVLAKSKDYAKAKEEEKREFLDRVKEKQSKKKWENLARVIPKVTDREYERGLQRIATKGVVQLFNAVRKQQKTREEKLKEVGGSQRKRAKVEASLTKDAFIDLLKGTPAPSRTDKDSTSSATKKSSADQPSWGVLRDDFMLGAEMKDWDKDAGSDDDDDDDDEKDVDSGLSSDSD